jgi:hypothetical protein
MLLFLLLLFSLIYSNFDLINIKEIYAQLQQQQQFPLQQQQLQQTNQMQWQTYTDPITQMSIQYPADWKVEEDNTHDLVIHSPDNSFYIGIENRGSSISIEDQRKSLIQFLLQKGFSLTSTKYLTNQYGPFSETIYSDNINKGQVLIEYLKENNSNSLFRYRIHGDPTQIQQYDPLIIRIFQTLTLPHGSSNTASNTYATSSQWQSDEINKMINENNQIMRDTLDLGVEMFKDTARQFADTSNWFSEEYAKKQCQKDPRNIC